MKLLRYWYYWVLDYWYVALRQVLTLKRSDVSKRRYYSQGNKAPVVVIPGVYERWEFMEPLIRVLHQKGHPVHIIEKLGYNIGEIPTAADQVMDESKRLGLKKVILIAHSKGGLIGKYAMAFCDSEQRISSMIAISTPFLGSIYARFIPLKVVSVFSPKGEVIRQLLEEKKVNACITSIYAEFDPHIPGGSFLESGTNICLPVVGHFRILGEAKVLEAVLEHIG